MIFEKKSTLNLLECITGRNYYYLGFEKKGLHLVDPEIKKDKIIWCGVFIDILYSSTTNDIEADECMTSICQLALLHILAVLKMPTALCIF